MNLGTLNTIIAIVVVLLVLSLVVQSIQTALKKLLTLKSKQIEESLKDLYDQAIGGGPRQLTATPSGFLGRIWAYVKGVKREASPKADEFKNQILEQFNSIGRVDRIGQTVLDSLAKDDLLKVMARLELQKFFPSSFGKFKDLCDRVTGLGKAVEILRENQQVAGAASAKISELRAVLAPLIVDVQALLDNSNTLNAKTVFGDLLQLTKLDVNSVLALVGETQGAVNVEIERIKSGSTANPGSSNAVSPPDATSPPNTAVTQKDVLDGLNVIATELSNISSIIADVNQNFNEAFSPLKAKLSQVEIWFDTVTQSFDERYTRHMRTVSICISIVVVILLNANFFKVYRNISTNEIQKNLIADAGAKILEQSRAAEPQPSPGSSPTPDIKTQIEKSKAEIDLYINSYQGFGFAPLSTKQLESFFWSVGGFTGLWKCGGDSGHTIWGCTLKRSPNGLPLNVNNYEILDDCREKDSKGDKITNKDGYFVLCTPAWRQQTGWEWWASRKDDVTVLLGWAVMVMLLSVGAPFWQDTLESLFGLKNLLRQQSSTQNVETESGTGQTK